MLQVVAPQDSVEYQQPQEEMHETAVPSQEKATQECVATEKCVEPVEASQEFVASRECVEPVQACWVPNGEESGECVPVLPSAQAELPTEEADALNANYASMLHKYSDTSGEYLMSEEQFCVSQMCVHYAACSEMAVTCVVWQSQFAVC